MWKEILKKYPEYVNTCSLFDLKDKSISFVRSSKYIKNLNIKEDVIILAPKSMKTELSSFDVKIEFVDYVDYIFTMIHNYLNKDRISPENVIGHNCNIHPTAVIGVDGMHVIKDLEGKRIQLKHMGNVVIEDDVMILALTTLQKAVFGSTIIKKGAMIDSHVNIGHNSCIGENTVLASGAIVGGSVFLGKNCMVGLRSVIRNGITICDDVIIGMGSVVTANITKSGFYKGSPAIYFKEYDKNWSFI